MGAWFIKSFMGIMEFLGRILIFNRNFPRDVLCHYNMEYSKRLFLDVFVPDIPGEKFPVLLYIHGGGWITGSRRSCRRECAVFSREGFVVINIDYRLAPGHPHPAQLEDMHKAVEWTYANKEPYKADMDRVFMGGSSAGAHLAALSAVFSSDKKEGKELPETKLNISGLILIYGVYDLPEVLDSGFFMIETMVKAYAGNSDDFTAFLSEVSPSYHIKEDFPPVFITAGINDKLFSQSVEFAELLDSMGIPCDRMLFYDKKQGAGHGFSHFYYKECTRQVYRGITEFMKKYSKKGSRG